MNDGFFPYVFSNAFNRLFTLQLTIIERDVNHVYNVTEMSANLYIYIHIIYTLYI